MSVPLAVLILRLSAAVPEMPVAFWNLAVMVIGVLLLLSFAVCFFGQRLFADVFVGRFCRILFSLDAEDEKE